MPDITQWLSDWRAAIFAEFGEERVRFLGLQGSRARGEAREDSDIDAVLILDELRPGDIPRYAGCTAGLPERDKLCGFVAGERELRCWESSELFQFYYDTRPVFGSLDFLLPGIDREAARRSARILAGNVYHGAVHLLLNGQGGPEELRKSALFALRALRWLETGVFPPDTASLGAEGERLAASDAEGLLLWASSTLASLGRA